MQAAEGKTVLVRRMKQGFAEYFRYQLKARCGKGLRQYVIGGWNTGKVPYGYLPSAASTPTRSRLPGRHPRPPGPRPRTRPRGARGVSPV